MSLARFWRRTPAAPAATAAAAAAEDPSDFLLVGGENCCEGGEGDLWVALDGTSPMAPALDTDSPPLEDSGSVSIGSDGEEWTADVPAPRDPSSIPAPTKPAAELGGAAAAVAWDKDGGNVLRLAAALSADAVEALLGGTARDVTVTTADGTTFASYKTALADASCILR